MSQWHINYVAADGTAEYQSVEANDFDVHYENKAHPLFVLMDEEGDVVFAIPVARFVSFNRHPTIPELPEQPDTSSVATSPGGS